MSDVGHYGVTQHADAAAVTADQLAGEHAGSVVGDASVAGTGPAFLSTAPYIPRKRPEKPGARGCWAKEGTCGAPALKGTRYCFFHSQTDPA